jgi:hypothetical protein
MSVVSSPTPIKPKVNKEREEKKKRETHAPPPVDDPLPVCPDPCNGATHLPPTIKTNHKAEKGRGQDQPHPPQSYGTTSRNTQQRQKNEATR